MQTLGEDARGDIGSRTRQPRHSRPETGTPGRRPSSCPGIRQSLSSLGPGVGRTDDVRQGPLNGPSAATGLPDDLGLADQMIRVTSEAQYNHGSRMLARNGIDVIQV